MLSISNGALSVAHCQVSTAYCLLICKTILSILSVYGMVGLSYMIVIMKTNKLHSCGPSSYLNQHTKLFSQISLLCDISRNLVTQGEPTPNKYMMWTNPNSLWPCSEIKALGSRHTLLMADWVSMANFGFWDNVSLTEPVRRWLHIQPVLHWIMGIALQYPLHVAWDWGRVLAVT